MGVSLLVSCKGHSVGNGKLKLEGKSLFYFIIIFFEQCSVFDLLNDCGFTKADGRYFDAEPLEGTC